jgi:hypothetical protein
VGATHRAVEVVANQGIQSEGIADQDIQSEKVPGSASYAPTQGFVAGEGCCPQSQ